MLSVTRLVALIFSLSVVHFVVRRSHFISNDRISSALSIRFASQSTQDEEPTIQRNNAATLPIAVDDVSQPTAVKTTTAESPQMTVPKPLVISRHPKFQYHDYVAPVSYDHGCSQAQGNSGNFLWLLAARDRLVEPSSFILCKGTHFQCVKRHPPPSSSARQIVHYYPSANMFYDFSQDSEKPADVDSNIDQLVRTLSLMPANARFFLLGVGAQAEFFPKNLESDLGTLAAIATGPDTHVVSRAAKRLFKKLEERKETTFFRGRYTAAVAKKHGYTHGLVTGCPSLMVSTDIHLGVTLEDRYNSIASRVGDTTLKLAINIINKIGVNDMYMKLLDRYPNSIVFAQHAADLRMLQRRNFPFDRVRFYATDVEAWRDEMKGMDACIGSRIHGNMIALSVGVPVFVIAPDHRVLELVDAMRVPHTDIFDRRLLDDNIGSRRSGNPMTKKSANGDAGQMGMGRRERMTRKDDDEEERERGFDVAALFRDAKFNGKRFDENRCRIAQTYHRVFGAVGMDITAHVKQIADIC